MKPLHVRTPLWESPALAELLGVPVLLKMEAFQPVGSFKVRGMGAACRAAFERGTRRVICSSGGNAGYAVAYAGRQLGLEVTIVVPETTSQHAKELIAREGAHIIVRGAAWDDSHAYALELAGRTNSTYVHPFDDPVVWQGHSTLVDEIAEEGGKPGVIVVSVGGGGLLCGILEGLHRAGWGDLPVVAVETQGAASFYASVEAGELVTLDAIRSVAVTLGAKRVTPKALEWTHRHEIIPWTVSDRQAVDACLRFADEHRVLVEPACGAALAAGYQRAAPLRDRGDVLFVVCGGAGVDRMLLEKWDQDLG